MPGGVGRACATIIDSIVVESDLARGAGRGSGTDCADAPDTPSRPDTSPAVTTAHKLVSVRVILHSIAPDILARTCGDLAAPFRVNRHRADSQ